MFVRVSVIDFSLDTKQRNEYSFPVAPTGSKKRRSDTRERILEAALELFVERGFHGTAVPLVAERAKVGAGTIYRHFANKEALVNELYRELKSSVGSVVLTGFPVDRPPREQFHAFWVRLSRFALDNPKAFAFLELHHHASYLDDASRSIEQGFIDFALSFIKHAQEGMVIKPQDPILLISIVYGGFVGVVRASWEGKIELTEEVLDAAEQCVWEAIRN